MNAGIFLIAVSLSMDAFSLALSYGTLNIPLKKCLFISLVVGIFHFFMPIIGSFIGSKFIRAFHVNVHLLSGIIFLYIAKGMYQEYKENDEVSFDVTIPSTILFALGVSLDSFGVGFTFQRDANTIFLMSLCFALFSFSFTFLGLRLGKVISTYVGKLAILFGIVIMILLAIINFVNFLPFG